MGTDAPQRPKTFEEMNTEEKVEHLNKSLTNLTGAINNIGQLVNALRTHIHSADGRIHIPLDNSPRR